LRLSDTTLEEKAAEIFVPLRLTSKQWYHIMAAWYSTAPGGLSLWIDGKPVGKFGYRGKRGLQKAILSRELKPRDDNIYLSDSAGLPFKGVVLIGTEVIEYNGISGNMDSVRKRYKGFIGQAKQYKGQEVSLGRGCRGTSITSHAKGSGVYIYGYSQSLYGNLIPATKLVENIFEENSPKATKAPISSNNNTICVSSTRGFQSRGF